jgi:hypothetical protein
MKTFRRILMMLVMPALFFTACNKDDEKTDKTTYKSPSIASRGDVVTIPDGLQSLADGGDFNAGMAVAYMGMANGIASFAGSFVVPDGAAQENLKGGSAVYHWTYGGYSYWMTYAETLTKYTWEYDYEFPEVPRFTFMDAEELKDGKSGKWAIYDPEDAGHPKMWDYVWNVNSSEDFSAVLDMTDGTDVMAFNVLARKNNSGSFTLYSNAVKTVEVTWNADGSGSWWMSDGVNTYSGNWTV